MDFKKVVTEPDSRPGTTSKNPRSDPFEKNIGDPADSLNSKKKGEKSTPLGRDGKPRSLIGRR